MVVKIAIPINICNPIYRSAYFDRKPNLFANSSNKFWILWQILYFPINNQLTQNLLCNEEKHICFESKFIFGIVDVLKVLQMSQLILTHKCLCNITLTHPRITSVIYCKWNSSNFVFSKMNSICLVPSNIFKSFIS